MDDEDGAGTAGGRFGVAQPASVAHRVTLASKRTT
jgi:hypothetical protein